MQYFFSPEIGLDHVVLDGSERQHLLKSLRKQISDRIDVLDGNGSVFHCEISSIDKNKVLATIKHQKQHAPPSWQLHLAVAPTKVHGKMEWMLEKCTELGLAKITFIKCQRSVRPKVNVDRLRRIAISAMKQSGRFYLPIIEDLVPFPSFVTREGFARTRLIAHCEQTDRLPLDSNSDLSRVVLLIGPEGDFTENEIARARAANFAEITLGSARLRTETAGLHVTSILNFINQ